MSDEVFAANFTEGMDAFGGARRQAFWQEFTGLLRGKSTELLSFDDIKARLRLRQESYRGLQDVPLVQIVGSVGRYRDFTRNFLPTKRTSAERWSRVYAQASSLEGLPPIELYKVGDLYFVRDGNHRVSVARQLGAKTIEAHVTELPTSVKLEPDMSPEEIDSAAAYALFLEETGLDNTRPHHLSLQLSEPARDQDMLGHVYLHQRILEHQRGAPVYLEDAAADWYDNLYRPAVTLIRKYDVLEPMPDRSEIDLYLWLVDHLRDMRAEFGDKARTRSFSQALVDYLTEHRLPVPKELLLEQDESVILTRSQVVPAVKVTGESDSPESGDDASG